MSLTADGEAKIGAERFAWGAGGSAETDGADGATGRPVVVAALAVAFEGVGVVAGLTATLAAGFAADWTGFLDF